MWSFRSSSNVRVRVKALDVGSWTLSHSGRRGRDPGVSGMDAAAAVPPRDGEIDEEHELIRPHLGGHAGRGQLVLAPSGRPSGTPQRGLAGTGRACSVGGMSEGKTITVGEFFNSHGAELGLRPLTGQKGFGRIIREPTVNRPGLKLAGFDRYFAPKRVQVIGNVETAYLRSLETPLREQRCREFFRTHIPCAVVCRRLRTSPEFLQEAEAAGVPLFRTGLVTMNFINLATLALDELFAPRGSCHGCMADIQGIGVVIQGESGIGKSEAVLGLLERGYSLVADDITKLRLQDGDEVYGYSGEVTRNLMEVRGIGIIDVAATFGVAAIRLEKRVDLVVRLMPWDGIVEVERLGLEQRYTELLGQKIPYMELPVRPGRDLARLIEVAALHAKVRFTGLNPAETLSARQSLAMKARKARES